MPEPIVITISHRLGRDEAKRCLDEKLGHIRSQLAAFASAIDYSWSGYRLDFSLVAMRQSVNGRIDIGDDLVRVEIFLPLLLGLLANKLVARIQKDGARLLDKPPAG